MALKNLKGQAAIEYLVNYGWAILVIAIVLVALYVMTQSYLKVDQCSASPAGFLCNDPNPQVFEKNGKTYINIKLHNKQFQKIIVSHIICTTKSPHQVNIKDAQKLSSEVQIAGGSSEIFSNIACKNEDNTNLELQQGQEFRGYVIFWYNFENDIDKNIKKQIVATVASTVTKG